MATIYKANGEVKTVKIDKSNVLEECQRYVGESGHSWVEQAGGFNEGGIEYTFLADEEGLVKGLPLNIHVPVLKKMGCHAVAGDILLISDKEGWH